jgi:hypothetical protein
MINLRQDTKEDQEQRTRQGMPVRTLIVVALLFFGMQQLVMKSFESTAVASPPPPLSSKKSKPLMLRPPTNDPWCDFQVVQEQEGSLFNSSPTAADSTQRNMTIGNNEKATLVIMSHSLQRIGNLERILNCTGFMTEVLDKIVIAWNNVGTEPPLYMHTRNNDTTTAVANYTTASMPVPIQIWLAPENVLTNRYEAARRFASNTTTTEGAILMIDDDIMVGARVIWGMIRAWQHCHGNCVVGLDPRHAHPLTKQYHYGATGGARPNMAITKTMMVHRKYMELYMKDTVMTTYTKLIMNRCEDISMALMVANYSRLLPNILPYIATENPGTAAAYLPFGVTPTPTSTSTPTNSNYTPPPILGYRYNLPEYDGISKVGGNVHGQYRTKCVRWSLGHFGPAFTQFLKTTK